ncbi:MAG: signal peptidase I [Thermoanaerobacteraceae bacterium]|nr:signal peptidase I [Thermoanaerobacteraceae bacterium]
MKRWSSLCLSVFIILLFCSLLLMFYGVSTNVFGYRFLVVISGSMEPEIPVGTLVAVKPVSPGSIREGDVITFRDHDNPEVLVTHRVVGLTDNGYFVTKGDANEAADPVPVSAGDLVGKNFFRLPYIGYLAIIFKRSGAVFLGTVVVILALIGGASSVIKRIKYSKIKQLEGPVRRLEIR